MSADLDGKAVVITGAGQGLGRAYALACAKAGAWVVVNDVNAGAADDTVRAINAEGGTATTVGGSVADWADAEHAVDICRSAYGRVDGFVANAAIMHMAAPWEETEQRLRAIVEVNVIGVMFGVRHAMRAMVEAGHGGSIVTVVSGAQHGIRGMSAYGATKGAVNAMTLNWAIEGAEHGIRVNAVSPWAMTTMTAEHLDRSHADPASFPAPEAIAPVVVALLSDATAGVNGRLLRFDGTLLSTYENVRNPVAERPAWTAADVSTALQR
ncbi:SDR family NAD(P)-dependent oxidoreductase [Phytohabitans suffuscus]|uniref:Short-chain dehydrogenase n=1 Tax=Phytohabitans suffuscus TaxID=624315 RepID=A0A6F8YCA0_9ACTN|nr:SDR family oxidoreductase [Phytohabitans suffuscus]BCB83745.1 short-chain dehydrogenase [Phytohabitans suffuscus]